MSVELLQGEGLVIVEPDGPNSPSLCSSTILTVTKVVSSRLLAPSNVIRLSSNADRRWPTYLPPNISLIEHLSRSSGDSASCTAWKSSSSRRAQVGLDGCLRASRGRIRPRSARRRRQCWLRSISPVSLHRLSASSYSYPPIQHGEKPPAFPGPLAKSANSTTYIVVYRYAGKCWALAGRVTGSGWDGFHPALPRVFPALKLRKVSFVVRSPAL